MTVLSPRAPKQRDMVKTRSLPGNNDTYEPIVGVQSHLYDIGFELFFREKRTETRNFETLETEKLFIELLPFEWYICHGSRKADQKVVIPGVFANREHQIFP